MADRDSQDYCYPTKCPKCGRDVFRGRYNGGIYWVELLGDPWPNHSCFPSAVRKKRIDWRTIFADHRQRALASLLAPAAKNLEVGARPTRPRCYELIGIDGGKIRLDRQDLQGMPLQRLAVAKGGPTLWGVSMVEVFVTKGLAVPSVSIGGFIVVRFRKGREARFEWHELVNGDGTPRAFFVLKHGYANLGQKKVLIVVEGPNKGYPRIDQIQRITVHSTKKASC